ncbi:site-specific DNA-methyltransferase [Luteibacter jiangsuensis]|uniref:Methyltransferase n=1 Tax=Luteibacter jiangsuensis TaxID=637577 RepID=A0ABX0QCL7_9GAMM|nr:site-specific DNA-methyltransferase [Luteibacter jiangsuensis]NID06613.1 site-specific DNA-methyltransferase [Luteibacter jiangsuensis]
MSVTILTGDCLELMRTLPDNSVDSVVTDPPYGIRFMGKAWDGADIERRHASADSSEAGRTRNGKAAAAGMYDLAPEAMKAFQRFSEAWAAEAFRVLKPGGLLLSFASPRTYHRMACGIEDAGFEVRDQIMWIFGSGFPKSHNGEWGGTACKPAHEPVVMARKPLEGTVAQNFAKWGTGGLDIDGCRIPTDETLRAGAGLIPCRHDEHTPRGRAGQPSANARYAENGATNFAAAPGPRGGDIAGRWPANVIHDGSDTVVAYFPDAPGQQGDLRGQSRKRVSRGIYGDMPAAPDAPARNDSGSAARFFYCAKATAKDREAGLADFEKRAAGMVSNTSGQHITRRDEGYEPPKRANHHPTVKPTDLMRYLCRLVTPAGGVVLDPFLGSGSTGRGAVLEGMRFIGMEMDRDYAAIALARIADAQREHDEASRQTSLFEKTA